MEYIYYILYFLSYIIINHDIKCLRLQIYNFQLKKQFYCEMKMTN